ALGPIVEQIAETMGGTAERSGCDFSFQAAPGAAAVTGSWDRLRIEQVVLTVWQERNEAVMEVRDHGPGVPEKDRGRIFERFERAASMRNHGGLGLGLYVSREIVRAHGGSIAARNVPDGGAAFTVRLPITAPPA